MALDRRKPKEEQKITRKKDQEKTHVEYGNIYSCSSIHQCKCKKVVGAAAQNPRLLLARAFSRRRSWFFSSMYPYQILLL
jgi:hypothetical protein